MSLPPSSILHGTIKGYAERGCRCIRCKDFMRGYGFGIRHKPLNGEQPVRVKRRPSLDEVARRIYEGFKAEEARQGYPSETRWPLRAIDHAARWKAAARAALKAVRASSPGVGPRGEKGGSDA